MPLLQRLDRASARDRLPRQLRRTKRGRTRGVQAHAQRAIIQALLIALPRDAIVHHAVNEIPSGDRRGQVVGIGVTPGFADLIVISGGRVLFLEVKSQTGRLRKSQEVFRDTVGAQGFGWALVRSVDDALSALADNGFTSRVRPARRAAP